MSDFIVLEHHNISFLGGGSDIKSFIKPTKD